MRLCLLLSVLLAGCAARQAIPIAAGADLVTTEILLAQEGYREANPFPMAQSTGGRVALKAAVTGLVLWGCDWLERHGHHKLAQILGWGTVGAWGAAATWHSYLMAQR